MSMLNFKYGLHENLAAQGVVNGTIYVTTDEKAMYVDLDNTRIRLSQIITLTTHDWQTLPPPYSTEAFYYLTDSNALLKYTGNAWTQINSTKDLRDALTGLGFLGVLTSTPSTSTSVKGQICTVGNANYIYDGTKWVSFGKVGAEILDLKSTVATHASTLTTYGSNISDLQAADEAINDVLALLSQAVGYTGSGTQLPSNPKIGDVFIHSGAIKVYCKNPVTAASAAWHELGNESSRIETLKARIEAVAAAAGDKTALEQLQTDLTTLTGVVNHATTGLAATKAIADAAKATAEAALPESTFNSFKTTNTNAIADAKKAGTDAQTQLATYKSSNDQVIDDIKNGDTLNSFGDVEDLLESTYATKTYAEDKAKAVLGTAGDAATENTVYGAKAAAAAADQKADNAQTTANTAVANAKTANDAIDSIRDSQNYDSFADVEAAINNLDNVYATDSQLTAAKNAVLGEAGYEGTVKGAYNAASGAQTTANTAVANAKTANDAIALIKDGKEYDSFADVETAIKNLGNTYATDTELSEAVAAARGNTNETVASVDAQAKANAASILQNAQDIADLEDDLISKMQEADAMVYMGTVDAASDLPTTKVSIGHTYKAIAEFTYNTTVVYIGDLLIAKAKDSSVKEDADGFLPSNGIAWDHVPSGYVADYNPKMKIIADTANTVDVKLTSAHANTDVAGDLGAFTVSGAAGSAITVSVASNSSNISIGMTWGTF